MDSPSAHSRFSRVWLVLGALGLVAGTVGIPWLYDWIGRGPANPDRGFSRLLVSAAKGFTVAYVFFVGSAIGSFINVVAYRVPLGRSVISGASACPRCRKPIRGRDNIPVFGWILLGGRCRHCGLPISRRYPLVEFWFGAVAVTLFLFEWITGAANLPGVQPPAWTGIAYTVWTLDFRLMSLFLFHFLLVAALSTWALFKLDRNPISAASIAIPMVAALIAIALNPALLPVAGLPPDWLSEAASPWASVALGLAGGGLLGGTLDGLTGRTGFNPPGHKGLAWGLGLTGLMLGWQAMLSAAMIFSLLFFLSRFVAGSIPLASGPLLAHLAAAVLLQICFWKPLAELSGWPGSSLALVPLLFGTLAVLGVAAAGRYLVPGSESEGDLGMGGYGEEVPEWVNPPVPTTEDSAGPAADGEASSNLALYPLPTLDPPAGEGVHPGDDAEADHPFPGPRSETME